MAGWAPGSLLHGEGVGREAGLLALFFLLFFPWDLSPGQKVPFLSPYLRGEWTSIKEQ